MDYNIRVSVKKISNILVVIENGLLTTYKLDDNKMWEVGQPSTESKPDIKLYSTTVSHKHGYFRRMDGIWFYVDYNGKNGTIYNNKKIKPGLGGRRNPVLLEDGDVLIFGGDETAKINAKTVWSVYLKIAYESPWSVIDTKGYDKISVIYGDEKIDLDTSKRGQVIKRDYGVAIYMGDIIYISGSIAVSGR